MMITNLKHLAIVLAFCVLTLGSHHPADAQASTDSPLAPIQSIYKMETAKKSVDWTERSKRSQYVTASLSKLWMQAEGKTPSDGTLFDFDLAADTNGFTLKSYDPKIKAQDASSATVVVTIHYGEKAEAPHLITYHVVREADLWKIDEISTKKWSLRQMLGLALKP